VIGGRKLGPGVGGGLLLLALLSTGCLPWMDRTERKLDRVANDTTELRWEQKKLAEEIAEIGSLLDSEGLVGDERRAELLTRLRSVEQSLEQLNARSQEQEILLRRMSLALDQLIRQPTGPVVPPAEPVEPAAEQAEVAETPAEVGQAVPDSPAEGPPELVLYDAAMSDFRSGNTLLARQGYEELVYRFPNSQLADNAAYWLAETLFAERDFAAALARFKEIEELYPDSEILAAVLLKLGYTQLELGDEAAAETEFRRLLLYYPDGEEAANAEHQLELLAAPDGESTTDTDVEPLPDLTPEESDQP
jgi:TolA-binding protein